MVNLNDYIFKIIEYDPTESPRGIITADEWNTIMNLLKEASNYTSKSLQEIISDLYTASQINSTELGNDGSRLIGVDVIPGVPGENVNAVLRNLKEQLDAVVLGSLPDKSITSAKLADNLNFEGDSLTFNTKDILTEDIIASTLTEADDNKLPTVYNVRTSIATKQDIISIGSTEPDENTPGNIYLQYIS